MNASKQYQRTKYQMSGYFINTNTNNVYTISLPLSLEEQSKSNEYKLVINSRLTTESICDSIPGRAFSKAHSMGSFHSFYIRTTQVANNQNLLFIRNCNGMLK